MKLLITFIASLFITTLSFGQTVTSFMNNGGKLNKAAEGASGFNPWLGAQLVHSFEGTGDFADNIVITGRLLYELKTSSKKFKVPVMGNISDLKSELLNDAKKLESALTNIVIGDDGLNVGIYPYFIINDYAGDDFYLLAHGSASLKMNGFQIDSTQTNYLNTGRFSAGLEMGYGLFDKKSGDRPITLSVTPVFSFFDKEEYNDVFGEERNSIVSLEFTGIIPISKTGIGLMIQSVVSGNTNNVFRAGIILSGQSK